MFSLLGYGEAESAGSSFFSSKVENDTFNVGYEYDPEGMQWFSPGHDGFMELLAPTGEHTAHGVVSPRPRLLTL